MCVSLYHLPRKWGPKLRPRSMFVFVRLSEIQSTAVQPDLHVCARYHSGQICHWLLTSSPDSKIPMTSEVLLKETWGNSS